MKNVRSNKTPPDTLSETAIVYDLFSDVYNAFWGDAFLSRFRSAIDKLFVQELVKGASILDVGCGTGQVSQYLAEQDLRLTGIDISPRATEYAKQNCPTGTFLTADIRDFTAAKPFDGVISTFNCFNHLLSEEAFKDGVAAVRKLLKPDGRFVFDLNMETGFVARWRGSSSTLRADMAFILNRSFDPATAIGRYAFTVFRPELPAQSRPTWTRSDFAICERCFSEVFILSTLRDAGFNTVRVYDAISDLNLCGEIGISFFVCSH